MKGSINSTISYANNAIQKFKSEIARIQGEMSAVVAELVHLEEVQADILSNLDRQDPNGETSLIKAIKQKNKKALELIVTHLKGMQDSEMVKAILELSDIDGNTALHLLAEQGKLKRRRCYLS